MGVDLATYRAKIGTFRHSFGVDVVSIDCYVNFTGGLKTVGSVLFIGILLLIAGVESNPGPPKKQDVVQAKQTQIKISRLPVNVERETLVKIFENITGQAGGAVKSFEINVEDQSSIIEFEDSKVVELVIQNQPILVLGTEVDICVYSDEELNISETASILVTRIPENIDEDYLEFFFENTKKQGGGKVKRVTLDKHSHTAVIDFEEPEAVLRVIEKQPIIMLETEIGVSTNDTQGSKSQAPSIDSPSSGTNESACQVPSGKLLSLDQQSRESPVPAGGTGKWSSFTSVFSKGASFFPLVSKAWQKEDKQSSTERKVSRDDEISSDELTEAKDTCHTTRIFVSGIPENATEEQLRNTFNNIIPFSDRAIKQLDFNAVDLTAIIELENAEAAERVTKMSKVHLDEKTMSVGILDSAVYREMKTRMEFCRILEKLNLTDKYPDKITLSDVVSLDPGNSDIRPITKLTDIPWVFLRCVMSTHNEARDMAVVKEDRNDAGYDDNLLSALSLKKSDECNISPLDIYFSIFQCCEPRLKQIMYQKLYLCKLAVPFLYSVWCNKCYVPTIAFWPLRSLSVENMGVSGQSEIKVKEVDVLELSTKTVAFARYGRPRYSKSKLLNSILLEHGCKAFYNIDCPSGMAPRFVSNGQVEIFWLPNIGDKRNKFPYSVTFFNMRGNLQADFRQDLIAFMSQIVDTLIIIIDSESLHTFNVDLENLVIQFPSVMFLIASSLLDTDFEIIKSFHQHVRAAKSSFQLKCLSTHRGNIEQNVVDIVQTVLTNISNLISAFPAQSFEFRITNALKVYPVNSDEDSENCRKGRKGAEHIHGLMKSKAEPDQWKQVVTPIQSKMSKKLGQLIKQRAREKQLEAASNVDNEITEIRLEMVKSISGSVKAFAAFLVEVNDNHLELEYFLGWLKFFIDRDKRIILPQLMHRYSCASNRLKDIKTKENSSLQETEKKEDIITSDLQKEITSLEQKIENASFSVDHIFRELGHIYDAVIESRLTDGNLGLPQVEHIAQVVGYYVLKGHQFELIDGESFLMPYKWLQHVFDKIKVQTGSKRVMMLSVLGLQSSGKSTLLNTMFGSQFATRSGRCTRGINMQLIPLKHGIMKSEISPFQYVAVIDTEGLRSTELADVSYEYNHDNELATVITGIGDITMINIMGENTYEIRNILQIVVHAFLRLKLTNTKLDITRSCRFVYQNIPDTCAADNMFSGHNKLLKLLDDMTQESARSEGILEINSFNHVIEFDINSHVWYLKNLWQGNQPMAMINYEYSEHVVEIKKQILLKAISMKNKCYKSIDNVLTYMHCLWGGVLTEDFVFSFRNSLEIKAYTEMEAALQNLYWQFEIVVQKKLVDVVANNFAGCTQKDELMMVAGSTETDLVNFLNENLSKTEKEMNEYFETNKYKDIVIQWKQSQKIQIQTLYGKLQKNIQDKIIKTSGQRSIEILTTENHLKHEDELCKKSMDVANKNKGKNLTQQEKDTLFEEIWMTFVQNVNISSYQSNMSVQGLQGTFIRNLYEICKTDAHLVTTYLHQSKNLTVQPNFGCLTGSFVFSGINDEDVSFSIKRRAKDILRFRKKSMTHVEKQVELLFEEYDGRIRRLNQSDDEITEHHILHLLHELQQGIANILKCTGDFVFKKPFYVKMYMHVSNFACHIFNEHNETYHRVHGGQARLNKYKQQQKISFEAHLNNRQYEDTIASLLSNVLDVFVREKSKEPIQISVRQFLYSKLPQVKNLVIISILTNLTEKDEFESFLKYIKNPTGFASLWLAKLCNDFLFEKESDDNYFTLGRNIVRDIFRRVRACVEKSLENPKTKQSSIALDTFIEQFNACLKTEKLVVPRENFRTLLSQKGSIDNILYLNETIMKYIAETEEKLLQEIEGITKNTVRWCGSNPVDIIIKKVWGCTEQCVYCGEPCSKTDKHTDSDHYSIQHRPSCCTGVFQEGTKLAQLESCNFDVQSTARHYCEVFGYLCNSPKLERCSSKKHKYREYKKYILNWDIQPSSNMYDTSQFWLWFVSKYKDQLAKYYGYKVDNIPTTWGNITKEQALKSLSEKYSA